MRLQAEVQTYNYNILFLKIIMWEAGNKEKYGGEIFCKNKEIPRCHERREERERGELHENCFPRF